MSNILIINNFNNNYTENSQKNTEDIYLDGNFETVHKSSVNKLAYYYCVNSYTKKVITT